MIRIMKLFRSILNKLLGIAGNLGKAIARLLPSGGPSRRREAERYARLILAELHRLGFSRTVGRGKHIKRMRVRFEEPLLMTRDDIWCPLNLAKLPTGVRTDELRDEAVMRSLEDRLNANVRIDYLANGKLCYVVRLGGSAWPATFSINAMQFPPDAPRLAFALGANRDGEHSIHDLDELHHLLVVGATGGGKSTFLHNLLYWLITRNSADTLELWLIDLKSGAELGRYDVLKGGRDRDGLVRHVATDAAGAIDVLNLALKEIQRRNVLMREHSASNLDDLARLTGQHLRPMVIVIDEIAQLMLDRNKIGSYSTGSWAQNLITKLAALGRSAGCHIIIATQMIQKDVLTGLILANFESRIAFSVADWRKSQLAIESSEADGLPVGRAILRHEGQISEYQTPLITPQQIRLEVERIRRHGPSGGLGEHDEQARFVRDAKLVLDVASQQFAGEVSRRKLLAVEAVSSAINKSRLEEICVRLERDGVLEAGRGNRPRRVARGYFARPHLLDVLYSHDAATNHAAVSGLDPETPPLAQQDAQNDNPEKTARVACGPPAEPMIIDMVEDENAADVFASSMKNSTLLSV